MRHRVLLLALLTACARGAPRGAPRGAGASPLEAAEQSYLAARGARDRLEVAQARGTAARDDGASEGSLDERARAARARLVDRLAAVGVEEEARLASEDRRALATMRRVLERELAEPSPAAASPAAPEESDCAYAPAALVASADGYERLARRLYACYGRAVQQVRLGDSTTDRLSVLSALGRESDPAARRRLFVALDTIWRTVNRDDGSTTSPYRVLLPLSARRWREGGSPVDASVAALGLRADSVERWLERVLARWRDATPPREIEPWDWWYEAGAASRRLGARIPLARLAELNERVYASLGASPRALGVRYDLAPRAGKTPVAFTTFGARPHPGGRDSTGEPWVFATYRVGGLDNLNELLHETGHAVHIAAVRARPAFADWPDSDTFTEALAELVAADAYEPAWQWRWLGDSATTVEGRRAKLAPVMLDVAWALLELRLHRDPTLDPNATWTALTHEYLRIAPHPELSWWAMRGQLVDLPGYMMNYALGAIITADLRAAARAAGGPFHGVWGARWYPWLSRRLYRFGLARGSGEVIREVLGRPLSPEALLREIDDLRE